MYTSKCLRIDTVYGKLTVDHPLLIELILCAPLQRLKGVNQYGVVNFIKPTEKYSRLDHSLGVLWLLQKAKAPLAEQVAGLLHDVSHTAFSHVGDFVFHEEFQELAYQDQIHPWFLKASGILEILESHGFNAQEAEASNPLYTALEKPLPDLCADRLDYNLQGGLLRGLLSSQELKDLVDDLQFEEGMWTLSSPFLAKKLGCVSLVMTETLWGAPWEQVAYRWTAEAVIRSFEIGIITREEFHFGSDQTIWDKLISSDDPAIQEKMEALKDVESRFYLSKVGEEDLMIKLKFRGLNPCLRGKDSNFFSLTSYDPEFAADFERLKSLIEIGWPITYKLHNNVNV